MKTVELTVPGAAERAVADVADGQGEDVVIFRDGRPVALIAPFDADDLEWYAAEHDPAFIASIARGRAAAASGQGITGNQLLRELALSDVPDEGPIVGAGPAEVGS
jgi:antitoxin (DNA-binding transcriptional repressor) of toxin-antitoxin stability system